MFARTPKVKKVGKIVKTLTGAGVINLKANPSIIAIINSIINYFQLESY